jgi:hypothetical protein
MLSWSGIIQYFVCLLMCKWLEKKGLILVFIHDSCIRQVLPDETAFFADSEPTSLLFLLNAACLAEKQQIPIL